LPGSRVLTPKRQGNTSTGVFGGPQFPRRWTPSRSTPLRRQCRASRQRHSSTVVLRLPPCQCCGPLPKPPTVAPRLGISPKDTADYAAASVLFGRSFLPIRLPIERLIPRQPVHLQAELAGDGVRQSTHRGTTCSSRLRARLSSLMRTSAWTRFSNCTRISLSAK